MDRNLVPLATSRTLLPEEMLEVSQLIDEWTKFKAGIRKANTARVYRQTKFNLLHEETEGYAKLLTALQQLAVGAASADFIVEHVVSLIGYFDLDPNRVCDMTLEAFERTPSNLGGYMEHGLTTTTSAVTSTTAAMTGKSPDQAASSYSIPFPPSCYSLSLPQSAGALQL